MFYFSNLQYQNPNVGHRTSFFSFVFADKVDESMIPVSCITPVCQGLIFYKAQVE